MSFVRAIERVPDLATFRERALQGLSGLIPCEQAGYNEIDAASGTSIVVELPERFMAPEWGSILAERSFEHPVIAYYRATKDLRALRISDFLSRSEFHRLTLYSEIYSKLGAEDQIAIGLPGRPGVDIGFAFNRGRRFNERDRQVLDLVRPHLLNAYQNALERSRLASLFEAASPFAERGVILLDFDDSPNFVSTRARGHLERFFPEEPGGRLPEDLSQWIEAWRQARAGSGLTRPAPFNARRGDAQLCVRYLEATEDGQPRALVLDVRSPSGTADGLRKLGLTPRQSEVLALVAQGSNNAEISGSLGLSPATVKKHLEAIYERIGVTTRAEAVAVAFDASVVKPG